MKKNIIATALVLGTFLFVSPPFVSAQEPNPGQQEQSFSNTVINAVEDELLDRGENILISGISKLIGFLWSLFSPLIIGILVIGGGWFVIQALLSGGGDSDEE